MGNCLVSNKVIAQDQEDEASHSKLESTIHVDGGKNENAKIKKSVSFKLKEDDKEIVRDNRPRDSGSGESGVLRVRVVVVTKEELRQIIEHTQDHKFPSVEQLLTALKLRNRSVSEVRIGGRGFNGNNQRLRLESIPEGR